MEICRIKNATREIGAAQGYLALPVCDILVNCSVNGPEVPAMETAWRPSLHELHALNNGHPLVLRVIGTSHPPVMIGVSAEREGADGAPPPISNDMPPYGALVQNLLQVYTMIESNLGHGARGIISAAIGVIEGRSLLADVVSKSSGKSLGEVAYVARFQEEGEKSCTPWADLDDKAKEKWERVGRNVMAVVQLAASAPTAKVN